MSLSIINKSCKAVTLQSVLDTNWSAENVCYEHLELSRRIIKLSVKDEVYETLALIIPVFFLTCITAQITTGWISQNAYAKRFILEFFTISFPIILLTTVIGANQYLTVTSIILCLACVLLHFPVKNKIKRLKDCNLKTERSEKINSLTNIRSTINIITGVAILAVDFFKVFPVRYHKTFEYGFSLMDVGSGFYIFANGLVMPIMKMDNSLTYKTFLNVVPIFAIGILRYVVTQSMDYYVSALEYGLHWNFFLTLGTTKLFSSIIMSFIKCDIFVCAAIGSLILIVDQTILVLGLEEYVFSNVSRERNLFAANREGIASILGYLALIFLSMCIGFIASNKERKKSLTITYLVYSTILTGTITYILYGYFDISRCLANSTYCFWVLFIGVLMTTLYFIMEEVFQHYYDRRSIGVPFIFDAVNYNGLTYFLIANIFTGLVNVIFEPHKMYVAECLTILSGYMLLTTFIICHMYVKNIRLKL